MKLVVVIFLILTCFCLVNSVKINKKFITKSLSTPKKTNPLLVGFDSCKVCIEFAEQALNELLNAVLNIGVVGGCGKVCSYVEEKTGSKTVGVVCNILCDLVGIDEFVKVIEQADLDPIFYCELLKTCKIKDDGDATIVSFTISPRSGPQGTTFQADVSFVSLNGTGTGELAIGIRTVDGIDVGDSFLIESLPPGKYEEQISIQAEPDPDCDPTQEQCEQWLPGVYYVEIGKIKSLN